jgi:hypothetical protein
MRAGFLHSCRWKSALSAAKESDGFPTTDLPIPAQRQLSRRPSEDGRSAEQAVRRLGKTLFLERAPER